LETSGTLAILGAILMAAAIGTSAAQAQTYEVLHRFKGPPADGAVPMGELIRDSEGNLYGTTSAGGVGELLEGVVFKLDKAGKETVLHSFAGYPTDGETPRSGVIRDAAGNLYGATSTGGAFGPGVVYMLDTDNKETILHSFEGYSTTDGGNPSGGLVLGAADTLYGTTFNGGTSFYGTVYKLYKNTKTVLYNFQGGADGCYPNSGVIQVGRSGFAEYYGTGGGCVGSAYEGVVFRLDLAGKEAPLYSFLDPSDGLGPEYGVIVDSKHNVYGTTENGGDMTACGVGCGVVFKLDGVTHKETVLYSFSGGADGAGPSGVVRDSAGNLYGTTNSGNPAYYGTVFKLDPTGIMTVLYTFTGGADGGYPLSGVIMDSKGNLYGTTSEGGDLSASGCLPAGCGVVFKIKP
jgi:uncharacterized repeat protein (TIGR03803 family)